MTALPLSGVKVLDLSTLLPGPLATLLLAEAGASVIKIERPDVGDEMRAYAPRFGEASANYALLNRGKRAFGALAVPISRALRRQPSAEPCPLLPPLVDGTSWDHPGAGA